MITHDCVETLIYCSIDKHDLLFNSVFGLKERREEERNFNGNGQ